MKKEKITFFELFYIFLFGSFFGWIVEGIWTLLKKGVLINHSALVLGPFNIVYGIGGVVLTLMLYKIKESNPLHIFTISFITGSLLEYIMSFLMEYMVGFVAWNYSAKFLNINGRICLVYSIFWGFLGLLWIKVIYPMLKKMISKMNKEIAIPFIKIILIFLFMDTALTFACIARGKAYEAGVPATTKVEEFIDTYFGVDYLNNMFNNRWNKK